jgi:hypothetical protein
MTQPSRRHHAICQSSDFSHSGQEDQHSTIIDLLFRIFPALGHLIRSRGKTPFHNRFYSGNHQVVVELVDVPAVLLLLGLVPVDGSFHQLVRITFI